MPLPRFYFNYRGPDDWLVQDYLGSETDLRAAEHDAQLRGQDILLKELEEGGSPSALRCLEVEDEDGDVVLYLPFWASLTTERSGSSTVH